MTIPSFSVRRLAVSLVAFAVVLGTPSVAWAVWSALGSGAGVATTATLGAPTDVTASAVGTGVTVTWAAPASGPAPAGYRVTDDGGTTVCGASALVSTTSCSYTAVPGTYRYTVTAVLHSWTATGTPSNYVTVARPPSAIGVSAGSTQTATVSTTFATALAARVTDSAGQPVAGVTVTFTAPGAGASGTFANATATTTATTNASGVATASAFTANGTPGSYTVTASVAGVTGTAGFALTNRSAPTVGSATAVGQGVSARTVTITGSGFLPGAAVSFGNAGITGGTVVVVSATQLTVPVTVSSSVAAGNYAVTVTNTDGGTGTNATALRVNAAPTLAAVSPSSLARGATNQTLTITGTGFQVGATVSFAANSSVTVSSVTVIDATRLTVVVSVPSNATARNSVPVTVTNPDGGTVTRGGIFSTT